MSQSQIIAVLSIAFGLVWAMGLWFLKRLVERIPGQEWFDSVSEAVKRIPSEEFLERLIRHLDKIDELRMKVVQLEASKMAMGNKVDKDHDQLGKLELEVGLNRQRLEVLEELRNHCSHCPDHR